MRNYLDNLKLQRMRNSADIFIILSVVLTFISIHAGFSYYHALFGLIVAIFASFAFETLRLASLFGFLKSYGLRKSISLILFPTCSITSGFTAQ